MALGPAPGKELVEAIDGVTCDKSGEDIGEISFGIDVVEFARFDERGEDRPVLAAAVGTGEQGILAIERERTNGALDDVGIDLDPSIVDEATEPIPPRQGIADRLGDGALLRDHAELRFEPGFQIIDDRLGALPPGGATLIGGSAANLGLDRVERRDAGERLRCDRRSTGRSDLVEPATDMMAWTAPCPVAAQSTFAQDARSLATEGG